VSSTQSENRGVARGERGEGVLGCPLLPFINNLVLHGLKSGNVGPVDPIIEESGYELVTDQNDRGRWVHSTWRLQRLQSLQCLSLGDCNAYFSGFRLGTLAYRLITLQVPDVCVTLLEIFTPKTKAEK